MTIHQNIPSPPGKFSRVHAIHLGTSRVLFISGLAASGDTPTGVAAQTERVFDRIKALLAEENAEFRHLVKITVILSNMDDYAEYNAVRNRVFADLDTPPASTAFEGRLVSPDYLVEIDAIAVVPAALS